jgi:hypothetical protein
MEARVQELAVAALLKLNNPSPLNPSSRSSSLKHDGAPSSQPWDLATLVEADSAHKDEGERLRLAKQDQEHNPRKAAERVEAARQASLYKARQEELNRMMHDLEAAKNAATKASARQREVATA